MNPPETGQQATASSVLAEMHAEIALDSPLFVERLRPLGEIPPGPGFSDLFSAACARPVAGAGHYRFALEYIFEGYLLHYGGGRLLRPDGTEFDLLAGDYMFARGLDRIALLEDVASVRAFANLVSLCSFVHSEQLGPDIALKAWTATAICLAEHAVWFPGSDAPRANKAGGCISLIEEISEGILSGQTATAAGAMGSYIREAVAERPPEAAASLNTLIGDIYSGQICRLKAATEAEKE